MTKKERAKLIREIVGLFPGWVARDDFMFIAPIGPVLRCVLLDRLTDPDVFVVHPFFQPLCDPFEHMALSFGERLKNERSERWSRADSAAASKIVKRLREHWVPFLQSLDSLPKVLWAIEANPAPDAYACLAARAHIAALLGDVKKSVAALDALIPTMDPQFDWQRTVHDRSIALRDEVQRDLLGAQQRIRGWEDYTLRHLGLQEFR